jgi:hypothetical protein
MRYSAPLLACLAALCAGLVTPSAEAAPAYVVIAATAAPEEFAPGREIEAEDPVDLPAGARLTLIGKSGLVFNIEGARHGPVAPANTAANSSDSSSDWTLLKRLVGSTQARSTVLGAARAGAGDIPAPADPWHMTTDSSGPRCTPAGQFILWRRDASQTQDVSLRNAGARQTGLVWSAGEHMLPAGSAFSREDGRVAISVGKDMREFEVSVMPEAIAAQGPGAVLGWLVGRDCRRQALALIARLHTGGSPE